MEINLKLDIEPFPVPHSVYSNMGNIPISSLSSEEIGQLCDDFRKSVFEKAGKEKPVSWYDRNSDKIKRIKEVIKNGYRYDIKWSGTVNTINKILNEA